LVALPKQMWRNHIVVSSAKQVALKMDQPRTKEKKRLTLSTRHHVSDYTAMCRIFCDDVAS
jgi:transcriptional regulator of NAD metabolism